MADLESPELRIGTRFRGLLIQSVLGEGGRGVAYLASHPILRIPMVVKIFKGPARPEIFGEAHLSARVASPYVVAVADAGIEDGVAFIVQRYVDGVDLRELITRAGDIGRRLPLGAVCRMIGDAARGLHAIHQAGVVHRDVKPANLFLCGDGNTTVGDFGIAVDPSRGVGAEMVGTPIYMAPELWTDDPIDRRTDVYSLGATAFELAAGRFPFEIGDMATLSVAHTLKPFKPPPAAGPREAYVFSAIERMLAKSPDARYPTAEAVARDLNLIAEPIPPLVAVSTDMASAGPIRVDVEVGDLAATEADVIVSAANWRMVMDVGVAGALATVAGPSVQEEAYAHAPARMGDVVWTGAGSLRARWVAHAVAALSGSICLQRCTLRVLLGAEARGARSVAFPALGTGVGDVPMDLAAKLMIEAVRTFAWLEPEHVRVVRIVLYDEPARARWRSVMQSM